METLKEAREAKGIKLQAVADHLGISRQTYSRYEANQDELSIEQAKAACAFIGCSIDEIFLAKKVN